MGKSFSRIFFIYVYMDNELIRVAKLSKSYTDKVVFENVGFSVMPGDFVGFVGRNGVGKTTLFNILLGHENPDSGVVNVCGCIPQSQPVRTREKVGIVPEKESPPSYFTPEEYFHYSGNLHQLSNEKITERITELADKLELSSVLDTYCKNLSRGQQQKVMIAKAFLHEPDIVLIDEPVVNLDPLIQSTVKEILQEYSQNGNTILLSTHDVNLVMDLCERGLLVTKEDLNEFDPQMTENKELLGKMKNNDE